MPPGTEYTLQDLAGLADVTPRTIRFYIAQGLLASPGRAGPGTTYTEGHLNRLRLIKRLQRDHLPLAEVRSRLAGLDDATVAALVEAPPTEPAAGTAIDYIRSVLGATGAHGLLRRDPTVGTNFPSNPTPPPVNPIPPPASMAPPRAIPALRSSATLEPPGPRLAESSEAYAATATPDRSQWDRVSLAPDVELHVRRPLGRRQSKRVERLITIAREILEEDQP